MWTFSRFTPSSHLDGGLPLSLAFLNGDHLQFSGCLNLLPFSSSGNAGIEAAVNWVVEHENDTDIDQMPMVLFPPFISFFF